MQEPYSGTAESERNSHRLAVTSNVYSAVLVPQLLAPGLVTDSVQVPGVEVAIKVVAIITQFPLVDMLKGEPDCAEAATATLAFVRRGIALSGGHGP